MCKRVAINKCKYFACHGGATWNLPNAFSTVPLTGMRRRRSSRAAASAFKVLHQKREEKGSALGYVIDHSTGAYVFDPAGRLRLYVKDTSSVADIAADVRLLLQGN